MNKTRIPFMHFMARIENGRSAYLLSPAEADDANGGQFVIPLARDGKLFPVYQFHYSFYLGNGTFFPSNEGIDFLSGFCLTLPIAGPSHLIMTFESFSPPRALPVQGRLLLPLLQKVHGRSPLRYRGKFSHADFEHLLAEVEPTEPDLFDRLLDEYQISIVGYGRPVEQQEVAPRGHSRTQRSKKGYS